MRSGWPDDVLVLDTETTTDESQRLNFGSWRQYRWSDAKNLECVVEGIFFANDLPKRDPEAFQRLKKYAKRRKAETHGETSRVIEFRSHSDFLYKVFLPLAFYARALVVGFNLPFDLTRLAASWGNARGPYYGGFSCVLWEFLDPETRQWRNRAWLPRLWLKTLSSKQAFLQFRSPIQLDEQDAERGEDGKEAKSDFVFGGNFLDLRTLSFALTGESFSLESACKAFRVKHPKQKAKEHGRITPSYIDYNRRDVKASAELLVALRKEFDAHPIHLDPCKAFSSATIAKAYLRQLGVVPPGQQFSGIPREIYGIAMNAYYGGRAEAHIRRTSVPVVHTDFISMYPTVSALMGLWTMLTAKDLRTEDYTEQADVLVRSVSVERYFDPAAWQTLNWFAEVEPSDDILPIRSRYDSASDSLNIGINHLTSSRPIWYAGPDLIAAALLGKKPPRIIRAVRIVADGRQETLRPVTFAGSVQIDPLRQDFFRAIVEERKRVERDETISRSDRTTMSRALKILANAGSYGVFAEMNMEDLPKGERAPVRVYSHGTNFDTEVHHPEPAGEFFFAPVASLITSAARLMLALRERSVTDMGGTYAFCDTDSMAIVATKRGGFVNGHEGKYKGGFRVRALCWKDVRHLASRFRSLSPYDSRAVPGSILRIEDVNFDGSGKQRLVNAFVISAKRYALYVGDSHGREILKRSEHGLGHLVNPKSADSATDWISDVWDYILAKELGGPRKALSFGHFPALSRISVSSPHVLGPFTEAQEHLPASERVRPANFLWSASIAAYGHPPGTNAKRFHLVRPFAGDPIGSLEELWTDIYSGHEYRVTTDRSAPPHLVQLKSYADVVADYMVHAEAKSADASSKPCSKVTRGLLHRRRIVLDRLVLIGKETNRIEDTENGLVHDLSEVLNIYYDPALDPWTEVLPRLKAVSAKLLAAHAGISTRAVRAIRNGHSMPAPATRERLLQALADNSTIG